MANEIRDNNGKFVQGNPGGPGRKTKAVEERYELAYKNAATPEDITKIMMVAVEQAKNGDRYARDFVFDRLIGPVAKEPVGNSVQIIMDSLGLTTIEQKKEDECSKEQLPSNPA